MPSRAGSPNRIGADVRELIHRTLQAAGRDCGGKGKYAGMAYLRKQAHQNPTAFLALVNKIVPTEVKTDGAPVLLETIVMLALEKRAEEAGTQPLVIDASALPAPPEAPSVGESMGRKPAAGKDPQNGSGRGG